MELVPAIIAHTGSEAIDKIGLIDGQTDWAHLDIMDGQFAPTVSWQTPDDLELMEGRIRLEAHLMVNEPERVLSEWLPVVDRVIVHFEAVTDLSEMIETFKLHRNELGVALLLETPVEVLKEYWSGISFVNLLSVKKIGYHGEPFDKRVLDKIKALRQLAPGVTISVDGGINLENAQAVIAAGADRLVVGGALWRATDLNQTINDFNKLNVSL
jgi:ribulose-phosphate 3-epimerase